MDSLQASGGRVGNVPENGKQILRKRRCDLNIFSRIRSFIKRKSPATFNAAEYETERVLEQISTLKVQLAELERRDSIIEEKLALLPLLPEECGKITLKAVESYKTETEKFIRDCLDSFNADNTRQLEDIKESVWQMKNQRKKIASECVSQILDKQSEMSCALHAQIGSEQQLFSELTEQIQNEQEKTRLGLSQKLDDSAKEITDKTDKVRTEVMRADLNAAAMCKTDDDFDKHFIPINRYFGNRGMAISMHLTSVKDKPDPIVYETADIIRTSALSLMADEINYRQLEGAVAELGVAQGKFARVINALFPERTLHLFDTFDGFPNEDVRLENERNFSKAADNKSYANIDMNALMKRLPHPEQCVIHRGYFPDTAEGFEESFCFVNIDCDLYKPIKAGLEYFYPRLVKGGCIFVHDYRSKFYRGVIEAVREYANENGISYCVLPDNTGTAVIIK